MNNLNDADVVLNNIFNNETFIFAAHADVSTAATFEMILGEGGSGGGNALEHVHPLADETFQVHSGRIAVVIAGRATVLDAGQSATVPRGMRHYFKNAGAVPARVSVSLSPGQQHLAFFKNFATLTQSRPDWFSAKGDPDLLLIALVFHSYANHIYLARVPVGLQKPLFAMLAVVARLRGYCLAVEPGKH